MYIVPPPNWALWYINNYRIREDLKMNAVLSEIKGEIPNT
jgi:hypothetical protein